MGGKAFKEVFVTLKFYQPLSFEKNKCLCNYINTIEYQHGYDL